MEYRSVEEARTLPGLRLVLTPGVPGPWGEAAKALFQLKGVPFVPVRQEPGGANEALYAWTGARNAPVAVHEHERPCSGWNEIVLLAERLAPTVPLLPADPAERASSLGLSHELCGPEGFGWCRRLVMLHESLSRLPADAPAHPVIDTLRTLADRYGYAADRMDAVRGRVKDLLGLFRERLRSQRDAGRRYLVGDALSATDVHFATFAAMIEPLPPEQCPMPEMLRAGYRLEDPELAAAADPILLEHRDFIYREHLSLPLDF
ncbi:MAG: hypothetical protein HKP30_17575 [Myxococcales bacterium]|nr:hypothetical protein [Myxococcales bacterium]